MERGVEPGATRSRTVILLNCKSFEIIDDTTTSTTGPMYPVRMRIDPHRIMRRV